MEEMQPLVTNEAIVFGLLMALLGGIFWASNHPTFSGFFKVVPALLLCYFLPSLLTNFHIVPKDTHLYFVASRYLLPASLVLLTLSIDLKAVFGLGPKALIMFFTATATIILGGPVAILAVSSFAPDLVGGVGPEAVWRGMATIAGSWIGGGANQAAMFEIFQPSGALYSAMITVDVVVAEIWMAIILLGAAKSDKVDGWLKADNRSVKVLQNEMEDFLAKTARIPTFPEVMQILGLAFGAVALAHIAGDTLAPWFAENLPYTANFSLTSDFFWVVIVATTVGLLLSLTPARNLEGAGASRWGSVFIYILVGTIGMKMDIKEAIDQPGLLLVGVIWMIFHVVILLGVARWIKAPFFFVAVGSKANIGGAASAPVAAAAFHPSLAPVGVLLAVLGYALGTYGGWLTGLLMYLVSGDPSSLMLEPA
ncbi:MAG: hypothetical protein ABR98_07165 [Cryomorphaceae bacterium BACL7 MAG-120910-bin2]|mgnify:FL=1|jgi:uncharacterized membrane protein|nr:MAG: hypothetical protein ABR98_07165 [Cryomorphaceae bacterium BACL7 MAG-120910-bin2]KRO68409.1 MAG: hypothetical protein ABR88_00770 [Cryomorphaceae bacterium BACL7 MAG-120322-bin74]KRO83044.1 MAG: hypothetical protein ABR87_03625 [Cryomorphaceae bacterium BACL7 MAG-121220-bin83]|tara:strand:+ start:349 stop:1620 length:1272 start_codon:yes stop_codon:yes gene_type:complete